MERIQVHPSGLSTFTECGERWRRKYIDGARNPPNTYLIVGNAVDAAVSADLIEKMRPAGEVDPGTGLYKAKAGLLPETDMVELAFDYVDLAFKRPVDPKPYPNLVEARKQSLARVLAFTRYAHRQLLPSIWPKAVQRPWSIRLDDLLERRGLPGLKIDYVGTLDIEEWYVDFSSVSKDPKAPPTPSGVVIRDLKTAKASPPGDAANAKYWIPMTSYALGMHVEDGVLPHHVQIDTLVSLKGGVHHRASVGERDDSDFAALMNRIENFARSWSAGIFPPASPSHWRCSRDWCEFFDDCPYTKNAHTINLRPPDPKLYKIQPAAPLTLA